MSKNSMAAAAAALLVLALSGCASTNTVRANAPATSTAQSFVDERMDQTVVSIDRSLQTLLLISRGGEAPRKPSAIADTVAGADVHGAHEPRAAVAVPTTAQGQRAVDQAREAGRKALVSRTRIDWSGDPRDLLRSLSGAVGYQFSEVGPSAALPKVEIHRSDASITDVLSDVARAIDGKADIMVQTDTRRIQLVYR